MTILPALAAGASLLLQSAAAELAAAERARFNACLQTIETDPEAAYEDALDWLSQGARPLARQCAALALIELGEVEEGALRLEALANAPDGGTIADRAVYLAQAGNAWLADGYAKEAATAFSNAIKLSPDDPNLRKDRAAAYLLLDQPTEALSDLDSALELGRFDPETLLLRGQALLALERYDEAMAAVVDALDVDPDNIDVLLLRGRVREAIRLAER